MKEEYSRNPSSKLLKDIQEAKKHIPQLQGQLLKATGTTQVLTWKICLQNKKFTDTNYWKHPSIFLCWALEDHSRQTLILIPFRGLCSLCGKSLFCVCITSYFTWLLCCLQHIGLQCVFEKGYTVYSWNTDKLMNVIVFNDNWTVCSKHAQLLVHIVNKFCCL